MMNIEVCSVILFTLIQGIFLKKRFAITYCNTVTQCECEQFAASAPYLLIYFFKMPVEFGFSHTLARTDIFCIKISTSLY